MKDKKFTSKTLLSTISKKFCISENATIHFIGIGGIGMSAIAKILHSIGFHVQGSDCQSSSITHSLKDLGVIIFDGHFARNVTNADLIVISSAISSDNPELIKATEEGINIVTRGTMLAAIVNDQRSVCVAGTHGKTSTTAMIAKIFCDAALHPMVINGGILCENGTNSMMGQLLDNEEKMWCIAETDESDGSFLLLKPEVAVVTNIDVEHVDHYRDFALLKNAFAQFMQNATPNGALVVNIQDQNIAEVLAQMTDILPNLLAYELHESTANNDISSMERAFFLGARVYVSGANVRFDDEYMIYDVSIYKKGATQGIEMLHYSGVRLRANGIHSVLNSLAAIAVALFYECDLSSTFSSLSNFQGVKRRFSKVCKFKGADVIDDYAHHPREILSAISTAKYLLQNRAKGGRVFSIVQPHRYTRLADLMDAFVEAIANSDFIIILEVYAACEEPISGVSSEVLYKKLAEKHHAVHYIRNSSIIHIKEKLYKYVLENDIILCLGAGDITKIAASLGSMLV